MKKILLVLLAVGLLVSITACSDDPSGIDGDLTGSLEEILKKIYENGNLNEDFLNQMLPGLYTTIINEDNMEYYLGKSGLNIIEAIASEHEMNTVAFSLSLIRVKPEDVESVKKAVKDNIDPFKWLCVGVEDENVRVENIGDVIILVMSNSDAESLLDAFRRGLPEQPPWAGVRG